MNSITYIFAAITAIFHVLVFVLEAFLLHLPVISARVVEKTNANVTVSAADQIEILDKLFFNQAFYNLFVALSGLIGFVMLARFNAKQGITLIINMCFFALGAGIVLACTTTAYIGAILQAGPPFVALAFYFFSKKNRSNI